MIGHDPDRDTAENYRRFARSEVVGNSPSYVAICEGIAADPDILAFLGDLPPQRRQPNLLLGAVRLLHGAQPDHSAFRAALLADPDAVRAVMLTRSTQTNEAGRCAVLLPLLAALPQPLALLEVGASAGLCLLPDRYAYRYGRHRLGESEVVLECTPRGPVPLPSRLPRVTWRTGIDTNPVDPRDDDAARWLEALVWPEQTGRAARLHAALAVARRDPPVVHRGDAVDLLPEVAAGAPPDATLVVFHCAVLAYLAPERRAAFADAVRTLQAVWVSVEAAGVTPGVAAADDVPDGAFVVARDGVSVGVCDPHGAWLRWG